MLKLIPLLIVGGLFAYIAFRMAEASKADRHNTNKPMTIHGTGIIIATPDELEYQNLHVRFKTDDRVFISIDTDTRFLMISKNGLSWFSIYASQVSINE